MQRQRILVVDDDDLFRDSFCQILSAHGYETVQARDGREGQKKLSAERFDLVVTDLLMPERDGIETIMAMRTTNPGTPVVAISGGGMRSGSEYLECASAIGAAYIFLKPLQTERVLAAIRECLMAA
jgi:DNA-binding NtrC family response regulator